MERFILNIFFFRSQPSCQLFYSHLCIVLCWKKALWLDFFFLDVLAAVRRVAPGGKNAAPPYSQSSIHFLKYISDLLLFLLFPEKSTRPLVSRDDFSHDAKRHFVSSFPQSKTGASPVDSSALSPPTFLEYFILLGADPPRTEKCHCRSGGGCRPSIDRRRGGWLVVCGALPGRLRRQGDVPVISGDPEAARITRKT